MLKELLKDKRRCALLLGAFGVFLFTVLRVLLLSADTDADTGAYQASYGLIALLAVFFVGVFVLVFGRREPRAALVSRQAAAPALAAALAGVVITVCSFVELYTFVAQGVAPAPLEQVSNGADTICLWGALLCGVVGGCALAVYGVRALGGKTPSPVLQGMLVLPVFWLWFRLARYILSYLSAMSMAQTFYDYAMMVFQLLFMFHLVRFLGGAGKSPERWLLLSTVGTAVCSLSNVMTRLFAFLDNNSAAFAASQLAGFADAAVGVLAVVVAVSLWDDPPVYTPSALEAALRGDEELDIAEEGQDSV